MPLSGPDHAIAGEEVDDVSRLRRHRAHLDTVQELAGLGSWQHDLSQQRFYLSPNARAIFDWTDDAEPCVDGFLALIHPDDRSGFLVDHLRAVEGDAEYAIDHRIVHPDGGVRHVREKARIIRDPQGRATRLVGIVHDRTDAVLARRRLDQAETERRDLLHHLLVTMDQERGHLASMLHDGPVQLLSAGALYLEQAASSPGDHHQLDQAVSELHDMIGELRDMLFELQPLSAWLLGLEGTLRELAEHVLDRTATTVRCTVPVEPPDAVGRAVIQIAHEALTNVRDHARARHVVVAAACRATETELTVADDGVGFDRVALDPSSGGLGVLAMEERTTALGGSFEIRSTRSGTTVHVRIPHP